MNSQDLQYFTAWETSWRWSEPFSSQGQQGPGLFFLRQLKGNQPWNRNAHICCTQSMHLLHKATSTNGPWKALGCVTMLCGFYGIDSLSLSAAKCSKQLRYAEMSTFNIIRNNRKCNLVDKACFEFWFLLSVDSQTASRLAWSQKPKSARTGNLPQLSTVLHFFEVALLPGQWHGRTLILLILVFVQWAALVPLLQEVVSCKHKLEYFFCKKEQSILGHTVTYPQCLDSGILHLP